MLRVWTELSYVGLLDCGGVGPDLELRNCPCGSTLAVERLFPTQQTDGS